MSDGFAFVADAVSLIGDLAGPYVLIAKAGTSIGGIIPDVSIQEVISDENTITAHPVQTGTTTSDHVFAPPIMCDLAMAWSDSGYAGYSGRSQDLYQLILALRDSRQPFDVYTTKRMLPNMLFGNITSTTDETNGNALFLRVRLQQVAFSDANDGSSAAPAGSQQFPAQTGPEVNMGAVALQPWAGSLPTALLSLGGA